MAAASIGAIVALAAIKRETRAWGLCRDWQSTGFGC